MKTIIFALISGVIFGAGLTVSTMVDPVKVLGFLDIAGNWDPTLAFVMGGGLAVYLPGYYLLVKPRGKTLFGDPCDLPTATKLDAKLILGASIFGVGWGLSGICPGPAITNLSSGNTQIYLFAGTMLVGMWLAGMVRRSR